jgi:hypothetical protein
MSITLGASGDNDVKEPVGIQGTWQSNGPSGEPPPRQVPPPPPPQLVTGKDRGNQDRSQRRKTYGR